MKLLKLQKIQHLMKKLPMIGIILILIQQQRVIPVKVETQQDVDMDGLMIEQTQFAQYGDA